MQLLKQTTQSIADLNQSVMADTQKHLDNLLKPKDSLGKLEEIAKKLAGISGRVKNKIQKKTIIVMASDNGVTEEKISSFPQEISYLIADTMVKGISGVAVLAQCANANLKIVDIGLNAGQKISGMIDKRIRPGTSNIALGPAMTHQEAIQAIETGILITKEAIAEGADLLGTGEVGIGNTTTSSAVLYALTRADLDQIVGRGAGLDDEGLQRKKEVIARAVQVNQPDQNDPIDVLAKVGGFDIAGLAGCFLGAAAHRKPILIDGFISGVAAVIAYQICPRVKNFMFPSHGTLEPGRNKITEILGLEPMLEMNMRLGEGTGCALAFHLIEAASKMINQMGTFDDIGMGE